MLERITGTEIYSRISEAAYERFAAEKEKLGQLETQLAASGTLSAEDRDATAARQKAKTEEAAALGKTLETLKAQLALYTRAAEIETSLAKTRNDLTCARTDAERQTPLKEKLTAARRAQPIGDKAALVLSAPTNGGKTPPGNAGTHRPARRRANGSHNGSDRFNAEDDLPRRGTKGL